MDIPEQKKEKNNIKNMLVLLLVLALVITCSLLVINYMKDQKNIQQEKYNEGIIAGQNDLYNQMVVRAFNCQEFYLANGNQTMRMMSLECIQYLQQQQQQ